MADIRVRSKISGKTGTLPEEKFDPLRYERLDVGQTQPRTQQPSPLQSTLGKVGKTSGDIAEFIAPSTVGVPQAFEQQQQARRQAYQQPEFQGRLSLQELLSGEGESRQKAGQRMRALLAADIPLARQAIGAGAELGAFTGGIGSTLKQVLGTGALRGGVIGATDPKAKSIQQALAQGAGGAALGAGASAALYGAGKALPKIGRSLRRSVFRPESVSGTKPTAFQTEDEILNFLKREKLTGSPHAVREKISTKFTTLGKELTKKTDASKFNISDDLLDEYIRKGMETQGSYYVPGDSTYDKALNSIIQQVKNQGSKNNLSATQLNKSILDLGNRYMSKQPTAIKTQVGQDVWKVLKKLLHEQVPKAQPILDRMSPLYDISKMSKIAVQRGLPLISFGKMGTSSIGIPFLDRPALAATEAVGRGLEGIKTVPQQQQKLLQILSGRAGAGIGKFLSQ
jgi:hypothetical protein